MDQLKAHFKVTFVLDLQSHSWNRIKMLNESKSFNDINYVINFVLYLISNWAIQFKINYI